VLTVASASWALGAQAGSVVFNADRLVPPPAAPSIASVPPTARWVRAPQRGMASTAASEIAVIPVFGVLMHRGGSLWMQTTSTASLARHVQLADQDPTIGTIVLDLDTAGGTVAGVQELADVIAAVRTAGRTRVVAVINHMAVSGGYWIASQADEVVITPSGMAGGIGVVVAHQDTSAMRERVGVKVEYISAGRFKAEGFRDGPLSKEHRDHLQRMVDTYGDTFIAHVARGRKVSPQTVRSQAWGQGRDLLASQALRVGMVDRIATFHDVIAGLLRRGGTAASLPAPSALVRGRK
jgi:capsid assembly protease